MLNRRLVSLVAAVSVVGLVATGCGSQSAAVRVGDESVSRSQFEEQLDVVYENDDLRAYLFRGSVPRDQLRGEDDPTGNYRQEYVGAMAILRIGFLLRAEVLESLDLELTDEDRDEVDEDLDQVLPDGSDSMSEALREALIDGLAADNRLRAELGDAAVDEALIDAADDADIHVGSRYGGWDPDQFRVTPPPGPAAAPDAAADADFGVGAG